MKLVLVPALALASSTILVSYLRLVAPADSMSSDTVTDSLAMHIELDSEFGDGTDANMDVELDPDAGRASGSGRGSGSDGGEDDQADASSGRTIRRLRWLGLGAARRRRITSGAVGPSTWADIVKWPERVVNSVTQQSIGAARKLKDNCSSLILTTSYSGMGCPEIAAKMLVDEVSYHLQQNQHGGHHVVGYSACEVCLLIAAKDGHFFLSLLFFRMNARGVITQSPPPLGVLLLFCKPWLVCRIEVIGPSLVLGSVASSDRLTHVPARCCFSTNIALCTSSATSARGFHQPSRQSSS